MIEHRFYTLPKYWTMDENLKDVKHLHRYCFIWERPNEAFTEDELEALYLSNNEVVLINLRWKD